MSGNLTNPSQTLTKTPQTLTESPKSKHPKPQPLIEGVAIEALEEFPDVLNPEGTVAIPAEIHEVDDREDQPEDEEQEEVLDVEGRPDEAPAERFVFQFKQGYHF